MEPRHDRVILVEAPEITMKILLDQMSNGWYDRLRHIGHDVYKVTELRDQGHDLQDDASIGDYAKGNGMVLVTRDNKIAKYCKAMDIQHIHLDDDDLFKILRQNSTNTAAPRKTDALELLSFHLVSRLPSPYTAAESIWLILPAGRY